MATELTEWINQILNERGWSVRELARRAGVEHSTVNSVLAEKHDPGLRFCNGIARAVKVPPERVFRLAGLLPSYVIGDKPAREEAELLEYFRYLAPENRRAIITLARGLYQQNEE